MTISKDGASAPPLDDSHPAVLASPLVAGEQVDEENPVVDDSAIIPFCSDGWHPKTYGWGSYYVYKSHKVVNGVFSAWSINGLFSLLGVNALFGLLAVNAAFSILSVVRMMCILFWMH